MHGRIEPVRALLEPEPAQDPREELLLDGQREVAFEERVVGRLAGVTHDRDELGTEHVEDGLHLGRSHSRLVLVEEGVVRRFARLHQLRPAQRDVVDALECGQEDREVVRLPGGEPRLVCLRALACPGGREVGRNPPRLLPVAPRDPDQARVVGVVVELGLERCDVVQQASDLVRDEALVCEPREGCRSLGPRGRPLRRHHRALIPPEHAERPLEVVDLGEALLQLHERCVHQEQTYP